VRLEHREQATLATVRRIVLGLVALGTLGMLVELMLVGHYDDANQLIPLGVAVVGLIAIVWAAVTPTIGALRMLQFAMLMYAGAAVIGITLHYKANVVLQLEKQPDLHGFELVKRALTSAAPPALAPGLMLQLALLGFAYTYKHPALSRAETDESL
jgi:hypothetical protein